MDIKETKEVTVKQEVVVAKKCDVCGKEIHGKHWLLTTSHNDWGNDSCESIKYEDLCSEDCVQEKLKEYFLKCKDSDTQEFSLEQDVF